LKKQKNDLQNSIHNLKEKIAQGKNDIETLKTQIQECKNAIVTIDKQIAEEESTLTLKKKTQKENVLEEMEGLRRKLAD